MGILRKNVASVADFGIEYLAGSKDVIFGPGSIVQGHVFFELKQPINISKVGIKFGGVTKYSSGTGKLTETQLFSIQEILWDSTPPNGKERANSGITGKDKDSVNGSTFRQVFSPKSGGRYPFLFAIKWPLVNFPPTIPPSRSVVQTEYVLRAFVRVAESDVEYISNPRFVEFRPRIDPSIAIKQTDNLSERSNTIVKDDSGRVLAEANLSCRSPIGTIFGSSCPLDLMLLIRQSEAKRLPRKAKINIYEIHKLTAGKKEQRFELSCETVTLPVGIFKPHQECKIPLHTRIPMAEIDSHRGALKLPTLDIGGLQVEYLIRVTVPLNDSRLMPTVAAKRIVVDCPVVVGNVKPKQSLPSNNVPTVVVNAEGERSCDPLIRLHDHSIRKSIVEWSEMCETPRFLSGGEIEDKDLLQHLLEECM